MSRIRRRRGELDAELGLPAGPAQADHHLPGYRERRVRAQVLLDQGQHQVVRGGDPGGGPHIAVPDVDRIGVDVDPLVLIPEALAAEPVRRGPPPVQQSGGGQQERA
jgi:hypothetical protein